MKEESLLFCRKAAKDFWVAVAVLCWRRCPTMPDPQDAQHFQRKDERQTKPAERHPRR
jgi:hypothetical protein